MFFPLVAIRRIPRALDEVLLDHEIFQDATVLDLVKAHPRFTVDREKTEDLAEGTFYTPAEKVTFETDSFRVTTEYLQQLRDIFATSPVVDFILVDIACPGGIIYDLRGMRPYISIHAQDDDSAIIKLTAEYIRSTCNDASPIVEHAVPANYGLVVGTVFDKNGVPQDSVFVVANKPARGTHVAFTGPDGKFLVFFTGGTAVTINCTKAGLIFSAEIPCTPDKHNITYLTIESS